MFPQTEEIMPPDCLWIWATPLIFPWLTLLAYPADIKLANPTVMWSNSLKINNTHSLSLSHSLTLSLFTHTLTHTHTHIYTIDSVFRKPWLIHYYLTQQFHTRKWNQMSIKLIVQDCSYGFIHNRQKLETDQVTTDSRMDKQTILYSYSGILLSSRKPWTTDKYNNMA